VSEPARRVVPITGEHKAVRAPSGRFLAWDLPVVLGALALLAVGWLVHAVVAPPRTAIFREQGLTFAYPAELSVTEREVDPEVGRTGLESLRVDIHAPNQAPAGEVPSGISVEIGNRAPAPDSLAATIEGGRWAWGPDFVLIDTGFRTVNGRELRRVRYRYAASFGGPRLPVWVTQYAWPTGGSANAPYPYSHVVTFIGSETRTEQLEDEVVPTLRIEDR